MERTYYYVFFILPIINSGKEYSKVAKKQNDHRRVRRGQNFGLIKENNKNNKT